MDHADPFDLLVRALCTRPPMDVEEIARELGDAPSDVRRTLSRAMAKVRAAIAGGLVQLLPARPPPPPLVPIPRRSSFEPPPSSRAITIAAIHTSDCPCTDCRLESSHPAKDNCAQVNPIAH